MGNIFSFHLIDRMVSFRQRVVRSRYSKLSRYKLDDDDDDTDDDDVLVEVTRLPPLGLKNTTDMLHLRSQVLRVQ